MSIYQRALRVHGERNQVDQAQEECAEFIVAANHRRRGRHKDIYEFAEEIADVEVMMKQMRLLTPRGLVDQIKRDKLARLAKRLDRTEAEAAKAPKITAFSHGRAFPLTPQACALILARSKRKLRPLPLLLKRALERNAAARTRR